MAVNSDKAIVTLMDARTYLRKSATDTADDQLIDLLVASASEAIAKQLGVASVVSNTYREFQDGNGGMCLWTRNYPVTSVDFASTARDGALTIIYSGGDASFATVEVTASQLKLRKRVSGVVTASTFNLADYATLTALKTAVEAVSGWAITIGTGFENFAPASLVPVPAKDATGDNVTLEVPDEGEVEVELDGDFGKLYNPYGWPRGRNNVCIEYTAGWARADVPQPIRLACLELVKLTFDRAKKDMSLKSETIGEYSYDNAPKVDLAEMTIIDDLLGPYKRHVIGAA